MFSVLQFSSCPKQCDVYERERKRERERERERQRERGSRPAVVPPLKPQGW